jgi:hypothetical protein
MSRYTSHTTSEHGRIELRCDLVPIATIVGDAAITRRQADILLDLLNGRRNQQLYLEVPYKSIEKHASQQLANAHGILLTRDSQVVAHLASKSEADSLAEQLNSLETR